MKAKRLIGAGLGAIAALLFLQIKKSEAIGKVAPSPDDYLPQNDTLTFPDEFSFSLPGIQLPEIFAPSPSYENEPVHDSSFLNNFDYFDFEVADNETGPVFQMTNQSLDDLYKEHSAKQGLDWRWLKALAIIESGENPAAIHGDGNSRGLMGVYCVSGSEYGLCTNKLNVAGWDLASPDTLKDADFNLSIASQILKWNIETYGYPKGIAVYNNWGARNDPASGPFRNQEYVDKFFAALASIGKTYEPDYT